jgi:hypothetical protein
MSSRLGHAQCSKMRQYGAVLLTGLLKVYSFSEDENIFVCEKFEQSLPLVLRRTHYGNTALRPLVIRRTHFKRTAFFDYNMDHKQEVSR